MKIQTVPSNWQTVWGKATFDALSGADIAPAQNATAANQTSAPLVMCAVPSLIAMKDFKLRMVVTNEKQTRTGSATNPWECFWLFFNWTWTPDGTKNANYFTPKLNGNELGTASAQVGQQFIYTDSAPAMKMGEFFYLELTKVAKHVTVLIDGKQVLDVTDERLYDIAGQVALYTEDCVSRIQSVEIEKIA